VLQALPRWLPLVQ